MSETLGTQTAPPEAWLPARRVKQALLGPIERFIHMEVAGATLLLLGSLIAFCWANSSLHASYAGLWHSEIQLGFGEWVFRRSLHFWVNEVFMTLFFLVAGLEIRRELAFGALSEWRRAALPCAGALGGLLGPIAVFFLFAASSPGRAGWGVPAGTGLAFSLGVLAILGSRVPPVLRVILLSVGVLDDIGCMILIGAFYSGDFAPLGLVPLLAGLGLLVFIRKAGVRPGFVDLLPVSLLWIGLYLFGLHPTLAGLVAGLTMPVVPWYERPRFLRIAEEALATYRQAHDPSDDEVTEARYALNALRVASREAVAPVERALDVFHPVVAVFVLPLFALANAGVRLDAAALEVPGALSTCLGIFLGLVLGKPLGIVGCSWLAVRLGLAEKPREASWGGLVVVGITSGIGFTLSMLVAELAFLGDPLGPSARLAILAGSTTAAALGFVAGLLLLPRPAGPRAAESASVVESTTALWRSELFAAQEPPPPSGG